MREDVIPILRLEWVQPVRDNVKAASNKTISVEGVIRLQVEIGWYATNAVLGVVPRLETKIIFETAFIDRETKIIETNNRKIVPKNGHAVAIVDSFEDKDAAKSSNDVKAQGNNKCKTKTSVRTVALKRRFRQEAKHM